MAVEDLILQLVQHLAIREAHFVAGGENSDGNIHRHAQEWLEANRDIVDP